MRIAIGEFAHETNTFCAGLTTVEAFQQRHWLIGDEIMRGSVSCGQAAAGLVQTRDTEECEPRSGGRRLAGKGREADECAGPSQRDHPQFAI